MSNAKVLRFQFIKDHSFMKGCARPPTIGEENDVTCVGGHLSPYGSSIDGKLGVFSASPRQLDNDRGFESERSTSPLPTCDRWRSSLHHVLEDCEGIRLFKIYLADCDEQKLLSCWLACKGFRNFETKNDCLNNSSVAQTTGSLVVQSTQMDVESLQKRWKLAKVIFSTYMKKDKCDIAFRVINDATKQHISKEIKNALLSSCFELDACLFDQAQKEIERYIEQHCYISFLNSDLLNNYAVRLETKQTKQQPQIEVLQKESEKKIETSGLPQVELCNDTATASNRFFYLPPLDEGQVWHPAVGEKFENAGVDKDQSLNSTMSSGVSQSALAKQTMKRNMAVTMHAQNFALTDNPDQSRPAYAYLVAPIANKYYVPPASANASDNASSDATSDTLSITDGSLDLEPCNPKKNQKRIIRHQRKRNSNMYCPAEENFISRTRRCNYKPNQATLATENPMQFFSQLKERMDKVVDQRRQREVLEATGLDSIEDVLDSHGAAAGHIKSFSSTDCSGQCRSPPHAAPPISSGAAQLNSRAFCDTVMQGRNPHLPSTDASDRQKFSAIAMPHKRADVLRKRKESAVGMTSNEVPDVMHVPAPPVDKNSFIHEWIKQHDNAKPMQSQRSAPLQRKSNTSKSGKHAKHVNPNVSCSTAPGHRANSHRPRPFQPISQDTTMPPLPKPDLRTTMDELKRRLVEDTEEGCRVQDSLAHVASCSTIGLEPSPPGPLLSVSLGQSTPGSSSGCAAAVASRGTIGTAPAGGHHGEKTTCIYFMLDEVVAYKIQIPHSSVTLGQFKAYSRRKGDFRYFFKQYSPEIDGPVFFEVMDDGEMLPLWDNTVVAKVKSASE